jgi:drug/metabolite transporter (DMT)-like permease
VSGVPAALLASLLWGTADFLAGRASRTYQAVLVAFVGQAAGLVALAIVLLFTGLDSGALLGGALAGAFGVVGVTTFYRALALGTMSIVAPVTATCAIVPVAAGVLLEGERPGMLQWIGVIAALIGVALASIEPGGAAADARKALRYALVAAFTIGLTLVFLDDAAESDALSGVFYARAVTVPALALLVVLAKARAPVKKLPQLGVIGLLDTGANTAFAIATTGGLLSLVAVLGGLFPIVTVALAYLLLHERLQPMQRVGVLLALAGIPLIST